MLSASGKAQVYPDKRVDELMQKGIKHLVYEEYEKASPLFEELKKSYPNLPLGWMYSATTDFSKATNLFLPLNKEKIMKELETAVNKSNALIKSNAQNPWFHYFLGLALGFKGVYQSQDGNWLGAISTGLSTISAFEKCLELDSSFAEAYVAIGTYQYWKGDKLGFLEWIPFVGGEKLSGIPLIRKSFHSFCYNEYSTMVTLFYIYMNEKDVTNALKIAERGMNKYPGSPMYKKLYARVMEEIQPQKSVQYYSEILSSYKKSQPKNRCFDIFFKYSIASAYRKAGNNSMAIQIANEVINHSPLSEFEEEQVGEKYEKAKKLKQTLTGK